MTIKDFMTLLGASEWHLDKDGNLSDENDYCPIWHVYHERCDDYFRTEAEDYVEAGRRCGLRTRDALAIAEAADNRGRPRLRKRLLQATGVLTGKRDCEE